MYNLLAIKTEYVQQNVIKEEPKKWKLCTRQI